MHDATSHGWKIGFFIASFFAVLLLIAYVTKPSGQNQEALQNCITTANSKYDQIIAVATATSQPNAQLLINAKQNDVQECKVQFSTN